MFKKVNPNKVLDPVSKKQKFKRLASLLGSVKNQPGVKSPAPVIAPIGPKVNKA